MIIKEKLKCFTRPKQILPDLSVSVLNTDAGLIVSYELVLKRKPAFYIVNIILPIIILGFITTVVFIIPSDAGEKIGFAVTVFLSFAVFLTIVSDQLPTNSENTAFVSVYIIIEVFLSVFALIVSAIQLRLHHRSGTKINKAYRCLVRFALFLRCKTCCSCRRNKSESVEELKRPDDEKKKGDKIFVSAFGKDEEEEEEEEFTWSDVSNALDVVGFFFFSFTNIAVTVTIFLVLIM
ncbi:hypothetical protein FSP39_006306 [Pinctada imbricata]|uniref:Neurotransmitter-gated ion-channel transmembrane domain-containing protein n=1 Tax=Pinctada imbricata TaxID=66713 RepID=A0AA89C8Q7_PINIB|nr:hypothetical protein FSP39_006306 [Pinctada imbricata]